MKIKSFLVFLVFLLYTMTGCTAISGNSEDDTSAPQVIVSDEVSASDKVQPSSELFSDRDFITTYDESKSAFIQLEGSTATCSSNAVKISGSTVTITDEGTYIISGTLDNGMIIVNSDKSDKTQIVLNGVSINSATTAAIYILQSDKVFITTAADSINTLSNGGVFEAIDENNIDAVIYSKEDLTLNGNGTLVLTSPGGHGVVSKDSLTITSGFYDINCASHALEGKDDICIADGTFTIVSGKDGIHAENSDDASSGFVYIENGVFDITSEGDGISSASTIQINNGVYNIVTGGGSGNATAEQSSSWGNFVGGGRHQGGKTNRNPQQMASTQSDTADSSSIKGIKSAGSLVINGGDFTINSADDAIHSNASVTVNNGNFVVSSGDDAFHADDTLTISDGNIDITESYEGLEGLHINVINGVISVVADDDGLNAAGGTDSSGITGGRDGRFGGGMHTASDGSINISGGVLNITAYGDGIDANGTLEITGGVITVCGPSSGDTATLDYDSYASITGGTFIGTGASMMAQSFSKATQGVIAVSVGGQSAGSEIRICDNNGKELIEHTPQLNYSVVIISSPEIVSGETYTVYVGSLSGEVTAD